MSRETMFSIKGVHISEVFDFVLEKIVIRKLCSK